MQTLYCATCDSSPLNPPRLINSVWYALCEECYAQNKLEPESSNVFLPLRFRVVLTLDRSLRADDDPAHRPT